MGGNIAFPQTISQSKLGCGVLWEFFFLSLFQLSQTLRVQVRRAPVLPLPLRAPHPGRHRGAAEDEGVRGEEEGDGVHEVRRKDN